MSKKEILNIPVKDKIEILEGTYIRMHDGSKKKVEDIVPTDLVYSYTTHEDTIPKNIDFCDDNLVLDWTGSVDEVESGNLTPSLVTGVVSESVDGYYVFNDNIKSTRIANFLVRRDTDFYFKRAKELQLSDYFYTYNGGVEKVDSINFKKTPSTAYCLTVDPVNTFFGSEVLVHNIPDGKPHSIALETIVVSGSSLEGSSSIQTHENMSVGDTVLAASIEGLPDTDDAAEFLLWEYTGSDIASQITLVTSSIESITTTSHQDFKLIETSGKSEPLKISDTHPVLAQSESIWAFEYVGDIDASFKLVSSSLEEVNITSINEVTGSPATGSFRRFDIEPQDTYFADGILVHN
jgi:hypothetical protein